MALASLSKRICTDILSSHPKNPYSPLCDVISRNISRQPRYLKEVGLPDFLKAIGNGVEAHSEKLANEVGDLEKLLETRTMALKKLGIPCKHERGAHKHTSNRLKLIERG